MCLRCGNGDSAMPLSADDSVVSRTGQISHSAAIAPFFPTISASPTKDYLFVDPRTQLNAIRDSGGGQPGIGDSRGDGRKRGGGKNRDDAEWCSKGVEVKYSASLNLAVEVISILPKVAGVVVWIGS